MATFDIFNLTESKMNQSINSFKINLSKIRTDRAHAGIFDHIRVNYHGSVLPLTKIAHISVIDMRTVSIRAYEKNMNPTIEKSIRESNLDLNPRYTGSEIVIPFPILTQDRRHELLKLVKKEAEGVRISIRNSRREANESLKKLVKEKLISEDHERKSQNEIQKLTNRFIENIENITSQKESEIVSI
ncbi:MAG: ribosome recycling factor [Bordetella sp.]|nr:MAG: ribosome recycling factor [Bordetella sp.]